MDYRSLDCGNRPDPEAFARDWSRTVIAPIVPLDYRLAAMLRALRKTHVNGGPALAQFGIEAADAVAWTLSRNRLGKFDFFRRFFANAAVAKALPQTASPNDEIAGFESVAPETLPDVLSSLLRGGGAYRRFTGSDKELAKLVRDFIEAVCGARFWETVSWVNWRPWTAWFQAVAWDSSFFWFDSRTGVATILVITDTD
jgi:hypothetical protein